MIFLTPEEIARRACLRAEWRQSADELRHDAVMECGAVFVRAGLIELGVNVSGFDLVYSGTLADLWTPVYAYVGGLSLCWANGHLYACRARGRHPGDPELTEYDTARAIRSAEDLADTRTAHLKAA